MRKGEWRGRWGEEKLRGKGEAKGEDNKEEWATQPHDGVEVAMIGQRSQANYRVSLGKRPIVKFFKVKYLFLWKFWTFWLCRVRFFLMKFERGFIVLLLKSQSLVIANWSQITIKAAVIWLKEQCSLYCIRDQYLYKYWSSVPSINALHAYQVWWTHIMRSDGHYDRESQTQKIHSTNDMYMLQKKMTYCFVFSAISNQMFSQFCMSIFGRMHCYRIILIIMVDSSQKQRWT